MVKLLTVFAVTMVLAYLSEKNMLIIQRDSGRTVDLALVIMVVILSLFCGLRIGYNDTWTYIQVFNAAKTPTEYLSTLPGFFDNPLFYLGQSVFKYYVIDNVHVFFIVTSFIVFAPTILFVKKYSTSFSFSMCMYFCLFYIFAFAALKQCLAMSILTSGVDYLIQKKDIKYWICLLMAVLVHAYAILFVVLLLFRNRPWTRNTIVMIGVFAIVMFFYEATFSTLFGVMNDVGKEFSADLFFDNRGINIIRVLVYAIPPMISLVFEKRLKAYYDLSQCVVTNMSIISLIIMMLGLFNSANLFGRSAIYFQIGTFVSLPWMINVIFTPKSKTVVRNIAGMFYIVFFLYGNQSFVSEYKAISLWEFCKSLF